MTSSRAMVFIALLVTTASVSASGVVASDCVATDAASCDEAEVEQAEQMESTQLRMELLQVSQTKAAKDRKDSDPDTAVQATVTALGVEKMRWNATRMSEGDSCGTISCPEVCCLSGNRIIAICCSHGAMCEGDPAGAIVICA